MADKKGFIGEFKEFISRGNVLDMAVGIIIGGAFTSIVTSLVNDIIMPIVGVIIGGVDFTGLTVTIGSSEITYGNFIQQIVNFLIIAFSVFVMVKAINSMRKKQEDEPAAPPEPSEDILLLREIRDSLKK
jgi:large conductance mechanosensitive channel